MSLTVPLREHRRDTAPHMATVSSLDETVTLTVTVDNMGTVTEVGRELNADEARALAAALTHYAGEADKAYR